MLIVASERTKAKVAEFTGVYKKLHEKTQTLSNEERSNKCETRKLEEKIHRMEKELQELAKGNTKLEKGIYFDYLAIWLTFTLTNFGSSFRF